MQHIYIYMFIHIRFGLHFQSNFCPIIPQDSPGVGRIAPLIAARRSNPMPSTRKELRRRKKKLVLNLSWFSFTEVIKQGLYWDCMSHWNGIFSRQHMCSLLNFWSSYIWSCVFSQFDISWNGLMCCPRAKTILSPVWAAKHLLSKVGSQDHPQNGFIRNHAYHILGSLGIVKTGNLPYWLGLIFRVLGSGGTQLACYIILPWQFRFQRQK